MSQGTINLRFVKNLVGDFPGCFPKPGYLINKLTSVWIRVSWASTVEKFRCVVSNAYVECSL